MVNIKNNYLLVYARGERAGFIAARFQVFERAIEESKSIHAICEIQSTMKTKVGDYLPDWSQYKWKRIEL